MLKSSGSHFRAAAQGPGDDLLDPITASKKLKFRNVQGFVLNPTADVWLCGNLDLLSHYPVSFPAVAQLLPLTFTTVLVDVDTSAWERIVPFVS